MSSDGSANHDRRPRVLMAMPTTAADHVRADHELMAAPTTTVDHMGADRSVNHDRRPTLIKAPAATPPTMSWSHHQPRPPNTADGSADHYHEP